MFLKAHMVVQDLWQEGKVEDDVLEGYVCRAAIKYDPYLGHSFLTKNKVAPVGHRRCLILESGETEALTLFFTALWGPKCTRFFD